MMKKLIICGLMAAASAAAAMGQAFSGEASAKYSTPFLLDVGAGLEYRTTDQFSHTDRWAAELDLSAKLCKWVKVGAGYNFIQDYNPSFLDKSGRDVNAYWATKHRVYVGATGSLKLWKLTFSLRERYQYTRRLGLDVPRFDDGVAAGNRHIDAKSKHILRSRLGVEFKPYKKCRFEPYVNYELYSLLKGVNHDDAAKADDPSRLCDKWRLTAGCSYKINKHNSVELFYRYVHATDADDHDASNVIGVGYSFKF